MSRLNVLFVLVAIVSAFTYANSLKCNICVGDLESDCAKGESTSVEYCSASNHHLNKNLAAVCFNMTYKSSEDTGSVIKGCGFVQEGEEFCDAVNVECSSCSEDLCN